MEVNENKYEKMMEEINVIFHDEEDYILCLEKTKEFLRVIKNEEAHGSNFRFAYGTLSKVYNKLGDKKSAIVNIMKAREFLKYSNTAEQIRTEWQAGMCYKGLNNKKALIYFNKCYTKSEEIGDYEYMGGVLDEIALINKDINTMIYAIDIYKICKTSSFINKQKSLDEMYSHLFNLYIYHNDELNARKILHKINDINIRKELLEQLNVIRFA